MKNETGALPLQMLHTSGPVHCDSTEHLVLKGLNRTEKNSIINMSMKVKPKKKKRQNSYLLYGSYFGLLLAA